MIADVDALDSFRGVAAFLSGFGAALTVAVIIRSLRLVRRGWRPPENRGVALVGISYLVLNVAFAYAEFHLIGERATTVSWFVVCSLILAAVPGILGLSLLLIFIDREADRWRGNNQG
jgi:hypothetical protein